MKKNTILKIFSVLVLILAAAIVHAKIVPDGASLDVTMISQEPDPGDPGEVIDVRFKVENKGGLPAEDITFEFIEDYPFSVYSQKPQQSIGTLQGQQKAEEGIIVLYKIKVDEEAIEKTYYVDIRYKVGTGSWTTISDFPLRVRTRDLVLSIESIESKPALISPGKEFELSFELRNNADSLIRDVVIDLDLSEDDIPFAPSQSTAEKKIYQINSKTGKLMTFDLVTLPEADGGIYKIPLTITYTDESGESYSKEDIIGLSVSSSPDLLITIDNSEIGKKTKTGNIVIKIVNRGLTNIKLVTAKLGETKEVVLMSEPEVYVGNIDSDDYETVDFEITVKSFKSTVDIPLELSYRDATNKQQQEETFLSLKTNSPGIMATIFSKIFSGLFTIAIIVGIGLGIRWLYKRKKKKVKRQG